MLLAAPLEVTSFVKESGHLPHANPQVATLCPKVEEQLRDVIECIPFAKTTSKQLKGADMKLEDEKIAIEAKTFMSCGIIVNPGYIIKHRLTKRALTDIVDEVSAVPCEKAKQFRFLRLLSVGRGLLYLTPDVSGDMHLLRTMHPHEIVGSLEDYLWTKAIDIIVANPDDEGFASPGLHTGLLVGFLFEPSSKEFLEQKVLPLISSCSRSGRIVSRQETTFNWFEENHRNIPGCGVWNLLQRHFEEAVTCPGLGDGYFAGYARCFPMGSSFLVTEWSSVLAFVPGIISTALKAYWHRPSCLVVAPLSRVSQLLKLITGFIDHLGVRGASVGCVNHGAAQQMLHIAVGTSDKLVPDNSVQQVVLVETDALLSFGFKQRVEELLSIPGVQVGLHACEKSFELEEMVSRLLPGKKFDPKAGLRLEHVDFYYSKKNKIAEVQRLWKTVKLLMGNKMHLALYCKDPESVKRVGRELELNGVPVCFRHSAMPTAALRKLEASYNYKRELLVTDMHNPWSPMDVLFYDMPETPQKFAEIAGRARNRRGAKIVIALVNGELERKFMESVAKQYNVKFELLPSEPVMKIYLHSKRRIYL